MKNHFAVLMSITLILALSLVAGPLSLYSASAKTALNSSAAPAASLAVQNVTLPKTNIYALTSDNMIYVLKPGDNNFSRVGSVPKSNGASRI